MNKFCQSTIREFEKNNKVFLQNKIIKSFLNIKKNRELLYDAICCPSPEKKQKVDKKFKEFYFNIRFISFISNTLYFNAINFDKRYRRNRSRNLLTVDATLECEESETFKGMIFDKKDEITVDHVIRSKCIEDYISDRILYEAVMSLTIKQREILSLSYINNLTDVQIAKLLNKSQQVVSKTHKKALQAVYQYIKQGENT